MNTQVKIGAQQNDGQGDALREAFRKLNLATEQSLPNGDRVIPLLQATPNQITPVHPVTATVSIDASVSRFANGRSIKVSMAGAGTGQVRWLVGGPRPAYDVDGVTPIQTYQPFENAAEIGMWIYIPDATALANFTGMTIYLYADPTSSATHRWVRATNDASQPDLVVGWNLFRWVAHGGVTTGWDITPTGVYRMDLLPVTTGAADVYVDSVWMVERKKASIIFVNDQSERYFMDGTDSAGVKTGGYPDMRARKLPCVFATQPGNWSVAAGRPTAADMQQMVSEGNEISFHSYAGEGDIPGPDLTADQTFDYTSKAMRDIKSLGIQWFPWRAALLGNESAALVADPDLLSSLLYAYPHGSGGSGRDIFPPFDRRKMTRTAIHNRTPSQLDDIFGDIRRTSAVEIHYTHLVGTGGLSVNIQLDDWLYYLSLVDAGIAEGWLELVTMEQLFRRHGGRYNDGVGAAYWEWADADGTLARIPA